MDLGAEGMFFDAGDIEPLPGTEMFLLIEDSIRTLLSDNLAPICLGGDHSITYPIIRAVSKKYPDLNILHFDAHPDLYDELWEIAIPTQARLPESWKKGLAKRLIQVGIRTINGHQREQAERFGVEIIEMRNWRDDFTLDFDSPVYISFDMDALDPAFAPGVSHREPGGLSTRQAIGLIQRLRARVVGADIVEFNPRMDPAQITAAVCAKLLKEIAAKMLG